MQSLVESFMSTLHKGRLRLLVIRKKYVHANSLSLVNHPIVNTSVIYAIFEL